MPLLHSYSLLAHHLHLVHQSGTAVEQTKQTSANGTIRKNKISKLFIIFFACSVAFVGFCFVHKVWPTAPMHKQKKQINF